MFGVPILLIAFNRPEQTARVLAAIKAIRPCRLYVACDGPRKHVPADSLSVQRVRKILTSVDWECHVETLFQDDNLGCNHGPRAAIDWFFTYEERGIILEDDCLPSPSFFNFCSWGLRAFDSESEVMAITGTNICPHLSYSGDYWVSKYPLMWGWASWRRAWKLHDPDMAEWSRLRSRFLWLLNLGIGGLPFAITWLRLLNKTFRAGKSATWWDIQWIFSCWINSGVTVSPKVNLVSNIGFDGAGTHTNFSGDHRSNLAAENLRFPLTAPSEFAVFKPGDEYISRHWFFISWKGVFRDLLTSIPGWRYYRMFWWFCRGQAS